MESTISKIATNTTTGYLDQGVLGLTVILFISLFVFMFYVNYKDRDELKELSNTLARLVTAQENYIEHQKSEKEHQEEFIGMISKINMEERRLTAECYSKVDDKLRELKAVSEKILEKVSNA